MILNPAQLEALAAQILQAAGSARDEAEVVAAHLVGANLSGHDSHGVGMIPTYVRNIEAGLLRPNTPPELVKDEGNLLLYEGARGYGQVAARTAMAAAIGRCRERGLALMGLRNAHHIGRVGAYGELSIAAGVVSLHFVNVTDHPPLVAPFGGRGRRLGTNPLCIAVPGTSPNGSLLLDMATSGIAFGKTRVARNRGEQVPPGRLIDAEGRPTRDPEVLFSEPHGALLPFGEHKGYGLALLCEVLAGALTGGGTIQPARPRHGGIVNHMLTILIDPATFCGAEALAEELEALIAYLRQTEPAAAGSEVLIPGDPERRCRARREQEGIAVEEQTWQELMAAARSVGLDPAKLL